MYWTCFSFRCTQKIRKKTRPTAPRSSTIRVQVSGRFPCLDVFKVETGNLKSTIQQHLSFPCSRQHCTSQTPRSHSAFGRSLTSCRASSSEGGLLKHGPPICCLVSSVRGPRSDPSKGRRVGAVTRCFGHMRTLKSEKPRRPIAQPLPSWKHELKWRQCLVHRNRCLTLQEGNICLHKRVALKATAAGAAMATSCCLEEFGLVMLTERV